MSDLPGDPTNELPEEEGPKPSFFSSRNNIKILTTFAVVVATGLGVYLTVNNTKYSADTNSPGISDPDISIGDHCDVDSGLQSMADAFVSSAPSFPSLDSSINNDYTVTSEAELTDPLFADKIGAKLFGGKLAPPSSKLDGLGYIAPEGSFADGSATKSFTSSDYFTTKGNIIYNGKVVGAHEESVQRSLDIMASMNGSASSCKPNPASGSGNANRTFSGLLKITSSITKTYKGLTEYKIGSSTIKIDPVEQTGSWSIPLK